MPPSAATAKAVVQRRRGASNPKDQDSSNLGLRIRSLRHERNWHLSDLSERSGIAVSTLSKVENGLLSLTYDRLQQVAAAFDFSLAEFLAEPSAPTSLAPAGATARISFARKGTGSVIDAGSSRYTFLCENLRVKMMLPLFVQCMARSMEEFGPLLRHEGEEFILVMKGRIQLVTEFYSPEFLEEGEGVYLDSRMGHAALNAGDGEAWVFSVNYQGGNETTPAMLPVSA